MKSSLAVRLGSMLLAVMVLVGGISASNQLKEARANVSCPAFSAIKTLTTPASWTG